MLLSMTAHHIGCDILLGKGIKEKDITYMNLLAFLT